MHTRERARVHAFGSDCDAVEHATIFPLAAGAYYTAFSRCLRGVHSTHFYNYATINVALSCLGC